MKQFESEALEAAFVDIFAVKEPIKEPKEDD